MSPRRFAPLLVALTGAFLVVSVSAAPGKSTIPAAQRPALEFQQGRYFRWSVPRGWSVNETANGVDLFAPDRKTFVSNAMLAGGFGSMTSAQFLGMVMQQLNPMTRVISARRLGVQPGIFAPWQVEEYEMSATDHGVPVRMQAIVGVSSAYGRYWATMTLYQSPESSWAFDRTWLPGVALSIAVTNPRQLAGASQVLLPRNNPLDNSGLMETWRQKGLSEDRISQAQLETTMGYERVKDPETGTFYNMPYENYDTTLGGYRNPMDPTEVLIKAEPGE